MKDFSYYSPEQLVFGNGSFKQLATLPMPGKKACVVCTPRRRFVDEAVKMLASQGVESAVYDKCRENPDTATIEAGAKFAAANGCDFVLSIGGGSTTDTAKCMALLMATDPDGKIWDYVIYYDGHKVPTGIAPIIVVSTTSGTGTEADPGAVLTEEYKNIKLDVSNPRMFPTLSIVDPELQVSVPKLYTACQGMDVIFHCTESYLNIYHSPFSNMVNTTGLKYAAGAVETVYREPDNLEARGRMAVASNLAGIGQSCCDLISLHACGHALGSIHHGVPHGYALCLMAPALFDFYCKLGNELTSRLAYLARVVGYGDTAEDYKEFIIEKLRALDMYYLDYSVYGIDASRAAEYAEKAVVDIAPYMSYEEHRITLEECTELFKQALAPRK